MNVKKLRVKPTNLKVEDDGMIDDSMPPFHLHKLETMPCRLIDVHLWTTWESSLWVPTRHDDAVSENSMPPLDGRWDGNKICDQKAGTSRVGEPTSTFSKLLAAGHRRGHLRLERRTFTERRVTQLRRGHQSDSQKV